MSTFSTEQALRQLQALGYQDGDRVYLRAFHPDKSDGGRNADFVMPSVPTSQIEQWQSEGRGVYLVVNPGGHSDADVSQCRAVFYEHDSVDANGLSKLREFFPDRQFQQKSDDAWLVPFEVQQQLWAVLGLPEPTLQVSTGGKSIHSYWTLSSPIDSAQWKQLQSDLVEFADADRKLKNPSRVMRLAGCVHAGTGKTAEIVGGCGKTYGSAELRALVPAAAAKVSNSTKGITWADFNQQWRFPIAEAVPLESCLSRTNRAAIERGSQDGSRNDAGFKLATDLLAVTAFLTQEGQRFSGDPYELFIGYCQRCDSGDGWNQNEWDLIWKSAQRKGRNSSLSPEMIEGCVKGWAWNNCPNRVKPDVSTIGKAMPGSKSAALLNIPDEATDEEKLRLTIANYNLVLDSGNIFRQIPMRRVIAKDWGLTVSEIDQLARELARGESSEVSPVSKTLIDAQAEIERRFREGAPLGVASGFYDLDGMTQGFQRSDLVILAARPSIGKTSLALGMAAQVAKAGQPVVIFSLEMSREQLVYRLLSSESQIESGRLRAGQIYQNEWEILGHAIAKLSALNLYIDDTPAISAAEVKLKLRRLHQEQGQIGLVLIDYLQLMDGAGQDPVNALDSITKDLKTLGRELNTPVIALSQLSRGVESRDNKRPVMSDIRASGGIEQNADLIVMLYRDEYYNPDTTDLGIAELIIVKHRNGPVGTIKLLFEKQYTLFRNLARTNPNAGQYPGEDNYRRSGQNSPQQAASAVEVISKVTRPDAVDLSGQFDDSEWEELD